MRKTNFPKLFFNSGYYSLSAAAMDTQKMMWLVLLVVNLLVSAADGSSSTLETRSHSNFIPTENSNLEVLKELGVDIQSEGRRYVLGSFILFTVFLSSTFESLALTFGSPKPMFYIYDCNTVKLGYNDLCGTVSSCLL